MIGTSCVKYTSCVKCLRCRSAGCAMPRTVTHTEIVQIKNNYENACNIDFTVLKCIQFCPALAGDTIARRRFSFSCAALARANNPDKELV